VSGPVPLFSACTTSHNGIARRIVTKVWISSPFDPNNPPSPVPSPTEVNGLWDTGATNSMLTAKTAAALGLVRTGSIVVRHVGGTDSRNTYLVNILLPNQVGFAGVRVAECTDVEDDFGVIIGMDLITRGDFSITNTDGETYMSFRTPSIRRVDYVAEAKAPQQPVQREEPKIGRNALCPCGSGKKYKRCHGS
jgi:hypothetical protein